MLKKDQTILRKIELERVQAIIDNSIIDTQFSKVPFFMLCIFAILNMMLLQKQSVFGFRRINMTSMVDNMHIHYPHLKRLVDIVIGLVLLHS